jgi:hypothetical protein
LFSLLINIFIAQETEKDPPTIFDQLKCGEEDNPKNEKDCTKYGTGSGMVCCFISSESKQNAKCRLVPNDLARERNIRGSYTFTKSSVNPNERYWDCGNNSNFIYIKLFHILLFMILL